VKKKKDTGGLAKTIRGTPLKRKIGKKLNRGKAKAGGQKLTQLGKRTRIHDNTLAEKDGFCRENKIHLARRKKILIYKKPWGVSQGPKKKRDRPPAESDHLKNGKIQKSGPTTKAACLTHIPPREPRMAITKVS